MDLELQGKIILVVGASNGLGHASTRLLLSEGAKVIGVARRDISIEGATESKLVRVQADMSQEEGQNHVREILASEGALHGILYTAGNGTTASGSLPDRFASAHHRNLLPLLRSLEVSEPFLIRDNHSSIVITSSIAGVEYMQCPPEYAATKSAVVAYSAHLARMWAPARVNILAPGNMVSSGSIWEKRMREDSDGLEDYLNANVALRRVGSPLEVARMAVVLLSPVSSFVSGSTLVVDGGQSRAW